MRLLTSIFLMALLVLPNYPNGLFAEEEQEATTRNGKVTQWTIEGMTCTMCAKGLQGGMSAIEGITNCTVDYASKTMVCTVDGEKVKVAEVPGLVEKLGYRASLKVDSEPVNDKKPSLDE